MFSTFLDYSTGIAIANSDNDVHRKWWLRLSLFINLGVLVTFKYFNFFEDNFIHLTNMAGFHLNPWSLHLILPLGISFYTFHGISYVLDIYYRRITPHRNYIDYALFVAYFPLLVAGPIERATHLLPQLKEKRRFDFTQGVAGLRLILWGMFKKVVIADSLAPIVDGVFAGYDHFYGTTLIIAIIAFSFQIYCDFSGYSDIARGVSRLFGIELVKNFNFPYFSRNIAEYWNRWHISLSSWLNDYVFTPLAIELRDYGKNGIFLSIFLTFLLAGFWHGAGWHFIAFGALNGLYYLPLIYAAKGSKAMISKKNTPLVISDLWKILLTYLAACLGHLFFRANSVGIGLGYIKQIFATIIAYPAGLLKLPIGIISLAYIIPLVMLELWFRNHDTNIFFRRPVFEFAVTWILVILCALSFQRGVTFIYFQF